MAKDLGRRAALYLLAVCFAMVIAWICARHGVRGYTPSDAIRGLLHGRVQLSDTQRGSVLALAVRAASRSFALVAGALFLAAVFAWLFASLPRRPLIVLAATLIGLSTSFAWFELAFYPGYRWGFLPFVGYCNLFSAQHGCSGPVDWASHLTLPWIALGAWPLGVYARGIRGARRRALRTAGTIDERRDVFAPLVLMLSRDFGVFLGWSVLVDGFFGIGGIGRLVLPQYVFHQPDVLFAGLVVGAVLAFAVKLPLDALWLWLRAPQAHASA